MNMNNNSNINSNSNIIIKPNVILKTDGFGFYHLLLKITNTYAGRIYICKHSTRNPYDKYMGSSCYIQRDIKQYGRNIFTKEIMVCAETAEILGLWEKSIVNEDYLRNCYTYNINVGGGGNYPNQYKSRKELFKEKKEQQQILLKKKNEEKETSLLLEEAKKTSTLEYQFLKFLHASFIFIKFLVNRILSIFK